MDNPQKYLSVEVVQPFPTHYSEQVFRDNIASLPDSEKEKIYIIPKTKENWQKLEGELNSANAKNPRLSWEESKEIWDKVNSMTEGFNKLLTNDKEIPPINNVIIIKHDLEKGMYEEAGQSGTILSVNTAFIEKYPINSLGFDGMIAHELGHHYDIVNNGYKTVSYDIKSHMRDSNPELIKWLEEKGLSDKDFKEAAKSVAPRQYFSDLLENKGKLLAEDSDALMNLYYRGDKEGKGTGNNFDNEVIAINNLRKRIQEEVSYQREFAADRNAAVLFCKDSNHAAIEGLNNMLSNYVGDKHNQPKDIAELEHGIQHPHPTVRIDAIEKIQHSCADVSVEELMKMQTPAIPRLPSTGKNAPFNGHSH